MSMKIIDLIGGARPNFMKLAALFAVTEEFPSLQLRFIHTGQHYDLNMSDIFLKELNLPEPAVHLGVGSGSHAYQTADIMKRYEDWIIKNPPDIALVVGDVNSTIACALAAKKCGIRVAHVEAGLRSFDRAMPEEINRILTDSIADFHFVTEPAGMVNLKKEGHRKSIYLVGNVMIDTLFRLKPKAESLRAYERFSFAPGTYALVTLHRPSNVDNPKELEQIIKQLLWLSEKTPIIFPVHPRTKQRLQGTALGQELLKGGNILVVEPLGYLEMLSLMMHAALVITDSGGMQEETTVLGIPCLTLRANTERPITITHGTNTLIRNDWALFRKKAAKMASHRRPKQKPITHWDGHSSERILKICETHIQ